MKTNNKGQYTEERGSFVYIYLKKINSVCNISGKKPPVPRSCLEKKPLNLFGQFFES